MLITIHVIHRRSSDTIGYQYVVHVLSFVRAAFGADDGGGGRAAPTADTEAERVFRSPLLLTPYPERRARIPLPGGADVTAVHDYSLFSSS